VGLPAAPEPDTRDTLDALDNAPVVESDDALLRAKAGQVGRIPSMRDETRASRSSY
jgi:hypothetical protein